MRKALDIIRAKTKDTVFVSLKSQERRRKYGWKSTQRNNG